MASQQQYFPQTSDAAILDFMEFTGSEYDPIDTNFQPEESEGSFCMDVLTAVYF